MDKAPRKRRKQMFRKKAAILLSVMISLMLSACTVDININPNEITRTAKKETQETEHSEAALAIKQALDDDPELMTLMEKSIAKAHEINPEACIRCGRCKAVCKFDAVTVS